MSNKKIWYLLCLISCLSFSNTKLLASELLFGQAEIPHHHSDNSHPEKTEAEGDHDHKMIAIPEGVPVPNIDLIVHKDAIKGWNLEIKTSNFTFDPKTVNENSDYSKGHAHLYLNGKKFTRIYSNWFYLESLPAGKNQIKVTINTNNHEDLMDRGKIISDVEIIEVSP